MMKIRNFFSFIFTEIIDFFSKSCCKRNSILPDNSSEDEDLVLSPSIHIKVISNTFKSQKTENQRRKSLPSTRSGLNFNSSDLNGINVIEAINIGKQKI